MGVPQNATTADPPLAVSNAEKSDAFEVGLKAALLDRRLSVDLAGFYQKFDGFIARFGNIATDQRGQVFPGFFAGPPDGSVDTFSARNYNGKATIKGVELTVSGRPTKH